MRELIKSAFCLHGPIMNFRLSHYSPLHLLLAVAATLALSVSTPRNAGAAALMDLEAGDILPMVAQLKDDLHLNSNQQILWQQTSQRTLALVRQRQQRRARLQADTAAQLGRPDMEFADLAVATAKESELSEAENRQLRELWLTVADALDDTQRGIAQAYIADRMQRVSGHEGGAKSSERGGSGGMGRGRSGGSGGMGGMGGMGGSGASINGSGGSGSSGATEF